MAHKRSRKYKERAIQMRKAGVNALGAEFVSRNIITVGLGKDDTIFFISKVHLSKQEQKVVNVVPSSKRIKQP
jgi:ribosomal protein L27